MAYGSRYKRAMDAAGERARTSRRDKALGKLERAGSKSLSGASKRGSLASMVGGMAGGKLGTMALGGLLGLSTGGIINPWTLTALTTGASALGSGLGAWGASKAAMGKPDLGNVQGIDEFADLRSSQNQTQSTLEDAVSAKAMKYGTNAAMSAAAGGAMKGYGGQMGEGGRIAGSGGTTGSDIYSNLPEGVSAFDYDMALYEAQQAAGKTGLAFDPYSFKYGQ